MSQRLNLNHGAYFGERIDIRSVLEEINQAGRRNGWQINPIRVNDQLSLLALTRVGATATAQARRFRIYISSGIHGDEPAGPLAVLRLLQENPWPDNTDVWLCPCLNPTGFARGSRENEQGQDLNRDYRHLQTAEIRAHVTWLGRQPEFDLTLCLHEDWEAHGFYVYELNPDHRRSCAEAIIRQVSVVCPIDRSEMIEGRPAQGGIVRPELDPTQRPQWPEAFYLIQHKTRQSYTLEAPSDFPLPTRAAALVTGVHAALGSLQSPRQDLDRPGENPTVFKTDD